MVIERHWEQHRDQKQGTQCVFGVDVKHYDRYQIRGKNKGFCGYGVDQYCADKKALFAVEKYATSVASLCDPKRTQDDWCSSTNGALKRKAPADRVKESGAVCLHATKLRSFGVNFKILRLKARVAHSFERPIALKLDLS